mmetsp:Transcript_66090/g.190703  ORF Transcript_66090/g.190703 Transcript_66090/m.190703 type:complete len:219 (+) Transcript_66090:24-680(+)
MRRRRCETRPGLPMRATAPQLLGKRWWLPAWVAAAATQGVALRSSMPRRGRNSDGIGEDSIYEHLSSLVQPDPSEVVGASSGPPSSLHTYARSDWWEWDRKLPLPPDSIHCLGSRLVAVMLPVWQSMFATRSAASEARWHFLKFVEQQDFELTQMYLDFQDPRLYFILLPPLSMSDPVADMSENDDDYQWKLAVERSTQHERNIRYGLYTVGRQHPCS